jgi:two-component system response regulator (stage 0 sporulation protein A)
MFNYILSSDEIKMPKSISSFNTPRDLEMHITDIIHEIGIPPNIRGYIFLREAIIMVMKDRSLIHAVTKELYPSIAIKFNTTAPRVERSMRHAIDIGFRREQIKSTNKLFGFTIQNGKWKPTNSEFIATIADNINVGII